MIRRALLLWVTCVSLAPVAWVSAQVPQLPPHATGPRRNWVEVSVSARVAENAARRGGTRAPLFARRADAPDSVAFFLEKPMPKTWRPRKKKWAYAEGLAGSATESGLPLVFDGPVDAARFGPGIPTGDGGAPALASALGVMSSFAGPDFVSDAAVSGFYHIPPDPHGAVSSTHVGFMVNTSVHWYERNGTFVSSTSLVDFFSSLGLTGTVFDPRLVWDPFSGRFLAAAVELMDVGQGDPDSRSSILLAASQDGDPTGPWTFARIDAQQTISATDFWADYPGVAVDEEAIYVTANMFSYGASSYGGTRLWIVDKTLLYDGLPLVVTVLDPFGLAAIPSLASTLQPAKVLAPAPVDDTGTWLMEYSGLTDGTTDYVAAFRVIDPLGTPSLEVSFLSLGNLDNNAQALPEAPQPGTSVGIETNDRRMLDAVLRGNVLAGTATLRPPSGTDAGQATALWVALDVSTPTSPVMSVKGRVGGETIATGTHTYFPSISIGPGGNLVVGFSASAAGVFAGAYAAGRRPGDADGYLSNPVTVKSGEAAYVRTFGAGLNRWGDYSAVVPDPSDDDTYWIFNQYAWQQGTLLGGENGQWATRVARVEFVPAPNQAPTAASLNVAATEDTPKIINLVGSDPDGDPITYHVDTAPSHGEITLIGSVALYTPSENYFGPDAFAYYTSDGLLTSSIATVSLTVAAVNDPPTAEPQAVETPEREPVDVTLVAVDVDGNPLTYAIASQPASGQVSLTGNVATYSPNTGFVGEDSFSFTASDASTTSSPALVTVTVTEVNDPPTADEKQATVIEGDPVDVVLTGSDPENDVLTFEIVDLPAVGSVTIEGAVATYTSVAGAIGEVTFSYRAFDGEFFSPAAVVTVTVEERNKPPVAQAATAATDEDTAVDIPLVGTDPESQPLSFEIVSEPSSGNVTLAGSTATYLPAADWSGSDQFTFRVFDGEKYSAPAPVDVTVTAVNDAPTAIPQSPTTPEDQSTVIVLEGSDTEGSGLTFELVTPPTAGAAVLSGASVTYTPSPDFHGPDPFTFRVFDGELWSEAATVSLTVSPVNDAPVATTVGATTPRNLPITIALQATDVDGDALTFEMVLPPPASQGSATISGSVVTFQPALNYVGNSSFVVRAFDGQAYSFGASVNVRIVNSTLTANPATTTNALDTLPVVLDGDPDSNERFEHVEGDATLDIEVVPLYTGGILPVTYPDVRVDPGSSSNVEAWIEGSTLRIRVLSAYRDGVLLDSETPVEITLTVEDATGVQIGIKVLVDPWPATGNLDGTGEITVITALIALRYAASDPAIVLAPKQVRALDADGSATDGFRGDGVTAWDAYLLWVRAATGE